MCATFIVSLRSRSPSFASLQLRTMQQYEAIVREREVFVPRGTDEVLPGDVVVVFTVPEVREEVLRLFRDPKEEASPT